MRTWFLAVLSVATLSACEGDGEGSLDTDAGTELDSGAAGDGDPAVDAGGESDGGACPTLPETIDENTTVGPGCVRIDHTIVTEEAILTIAAGTTVRMAAAGVLDVAPYNDGSALVAVGSAEAPIVFTADSATPLAGDWQCVHIGGGSSGSELRHVTLEYGGEPCSYNGAGNEGQLIVDAAARAISDNVFRHSSSHGVNLQYQSGVRAFENNHFEANEKPSLLVAAPQLLALGTGLTFADADDYIDVDTTFSLSETGTLLGQPVPFRIGGNMEIDDAAEVTFGAGVNLKFTGGSLVVFNANLIVAGSEAAPVTFSSAQATPAAGDWGCITFSSVTGTPRMDHAIIEYAGNGMGCSGAVFETAIDAVDTMLITNTTFANIAGSAVRAAECNPDWCSNTFDAVDLGPLVCGLGTPEEDDCVP